MTVPTSGGRASILRLINVTKEEILTQYLVENQAGFYRLAYSVLKNQDEALDAVQTAVCHSLERQNNELQIPLKRPLSNLEKSNIIHRK